MAAWYEPRKRWIVPADWPKLIRTLEKDKCIALVQSRKVAKDAEEHGVPKSKIKVLPLAGVKPGQILAVPKETYEDMKAKYDRARAELKELAGERGRKAKQ